MKEVTQDQFYEKIGKLDCFSRITNSKFPYSHDFILKSNQKVIGKIIDHFDQNPNVYRVLSKYLLND